MPTCLDIVTRTLRKLNAVPIGQVAGADEAASALSVLQSIYQEMIAWGAFGRLYDALVTADLTAFEQMRVCCSLDTLTVTLPTQVPFYWDFGFGVNLYPFGDGWDNACWWGPPLYYPGETTPISGAARPPRDGALIEVVKPSSTTSNVYDAQSQTWVNVAGLSLADPAPFSGRYQKALAALLTEELWGDYNAGETPNTVKTDARNARSLFSHRYDRPERARVGQFF